MELFFFSPRENRYSINALIGALEDYVLENHIPVHFCYTHDELIEHIKSLPDSKLKLVCLSFFSTQIWEVMELIKRIKRYKNTLVIAGGPHPTAAALKTLEMGADFVIRGEGEETLGRLLDAIKGDGNMDSLQGVVYRKSNGDFVDLGRSMPVDLDRYRPFSARFKRFGPVEITRGCPFGCHYCQTPRLFKGKIRHRSIEKIVEAVEERLKRGLGDIRFITPNALSYGSPDGREVNLKAIEVLLKTVKSVLGNSGRIFFGSFPSEVRPEQITEDVLEILKRYVDNDNIVVGAQSGSNRIIKLCHRGHTVEDVYRAVRLGIKAGFKMNVDFIFSLPEEDERDIRETEEFILDLVSMGARVHAHTFMPLPQTPFQKQRPRDIDKRYIKLINRLMPRGVVFGDWQKQAAIARRLYQFLSA